MKEVLVIPTVDMKRIIAAATVLIALTIAKVYLDQKQRRSTGASLEISYSGKAVRFSALRDSGNMLRDPLSGRYVAILSSKAADKLGVCEGSIINDTLKMRVIPIKSVGHRGILYAFVPDFAKVDGKKCEIVVALDKKNASFSGFEAIIPANL